MRTSRKIQMACAWSGPVFVAIWLVGMWPIQHFLPAPKPSASAQAIATMYRHHLTGIRVGAVFEFVAVALFATFGGVIAARTRRAEGVSPVIAYVQLACVAAGTALATVIPVTWAVAAFRPDTVSPDLVLTFNDFGWFLFLITFPVFSLWAFAIAAAVFTDRSSSPVFPRWVGYLNVWAGMLYFPAGAIIFFKDGPLAFNGILGMYVPLAAFFIWMICMTSELIKGIKRDSATDGTVERAVRDPLTAGAS